MRPPAGYRQPRSPDEIGPFTTETPKPKITGYRTLTDAEITIINRVKAKAEEVRALLDEINVNDASDLRWLSIGRTDLQKGFMAVIRAVARPETF